MTFLMYEGPNPGTDGHHKDDCKAYGNVEFPASREWFPANRAYGSFDAKDNIDIRNEEDRFDMLGHCS